MDSTPVLKLCIHHKLAPAEFAIKCFFTHYCCEVNKATANNGFVVNGTFVMFLSLMSTKPFTTFCFYREPFLSLYGFTFPFIVKFTACIINLLSLVKFSELVSIVCSQEPGRIIISSVPLSALFVVLIRTLVRLSRIIAVCSITSIAGVY